MYRIDCLRINSASVYISDLQSSDCYTIKFFTRKPPRHDGTLSRLMEDGSPAPTGQVSSQVSKSPSEDKESKSDEDKAHTVAEKSEPDKGFVEVILSLLARREVEDLTSERSSLSGKRRSAQKSTTTRRSTFNNSQSLKRALALAEIIPDGFHTPETSGDVSTAGLPPVPLPGGRGVNPPHENFLQLASAIAVPGTPPIRILRNGMVQANVLAPNR